MAVLGCIVSFLKLIYKILNIKRLILNVNL